MPEEEEEDIVEAVIGAITHQEQEVLVAIHPEGHPCPVGSGAVLAVSRK